MRLALVSLDEPAAAAHKLLDLVLHLVEGLLDHHGEIAIGKAPGRFAFDHQLGARHLEVDADLVRVALLVMPVGLVDDHATAHDPIVNALQARGRFLDGTLDHPGMGKVMERDLKRSVHGRSLARDDRGGWDQPPVAGGVLPEFSMPKRGERWVSIGSGWHCPSSFGKVRNRRRASRQATGRTDMSNWSMSVGIGPIFPRSSPFIISHPTTDSQETTLERWESSSALERFTHVLRTAPRAGTSR